MEPKTYRCFFHYNKLVHKITVHFRGKFYLTKDLDCTVPVNSKWNVSQPYLVMQGWAEEILVEKDKITIL